MHILHAYLHTLPWAMVTKLTYFFLGGDLQAPPIYSPLPKG